MTRAMKRCFTLLLAAGAACCSGALHAAETLGTVPDSAEALGMSGGRYANLADPSALHSTPANIAGFTQPEAELNFAVWRGDVTFQQAGTGETVKMLDPWKILGSLYYVHPIVPGKVVLGLGVTTPYGLDSQWPKSGPLRYLIPYEATLLTLDINPVLAIRPTRQLSLGLGLDVMYSSIELRQLYPWAAYGGGRALADGVTHFSADGWGLGAYAGLTWQVTPRQRISVIGRLPLEIDYSGHFGVSRIPRRFAPPGISSRSEFKSNVRFPGSIAAGYGLDVTDRLTLGADFLWAANSSHDDLPLEIGHNQALLGTRGAALHWKNAISLGAGLQYKLPGGWTARAGYLYSESSQTDAFYTPSVPSNDRHLLSLGIGYRSGRHGFNLGYSYSLFPDRTVTGNLQPAFNGKYQIGWHVLSTSYSVQF